MKYENKMEKLHNEIRKGLTILSFELRSNSNGRDNYYGIFSGVEYARLTTKRGNREVAKELEKILAERGQKKKITQFIKRLGKSSFPILHCQI